MRSVIPQLRLENRNFLVQTEYAEYTPIGPASKSLAIFKYKRSMRNVLLQLRVENRNFSVQIWHAEHTPATQTRKSQFLSINVVRGVHPRSSDWRIATFKYKCSMWNNLRSSGSTCAEQFAQSHLRRATCHCNLPEQLHKALVQSNLHRPTCIEHMRKACTELLA